MHNQPSQFTLLASNPGSYSEDRILCFKEKYIVVSSKKTHPNLTHKKTTQNNNRNKTPCYMKSSTNSIRILCLFFLSIITDLVKVILTYYNLFGFNTLPGFSWATHLNVEILKTYLTFKTLSS